VAETDEPVPTCPPHRWFIEAEYKPEGSTETWTCAYCGETKLVTRERDLPKPPWVVGREGKSASAANAANAANPANAEPKPDDAAPAPSPTPATPE
jgi:hypothetical protein